MNSEVKTEVISSGPDLTILGLFFQAEDGIRDKSRSRGLGDVYKRQVQYYKKRKKIFYGI